MHWILVIATSIYAINKGWYSKWPGLTSSQVPKHLSPSEHTSMGYMKMIAKAIRSTRKVPPVVQDDEPEPHPDSITEPTSNIHDVFAHCIENPLYADCNTIVVDLPGRYPDTFFDGHKYIYVMYDTITNYINAKRLTLRRAPELIRIFEECYNDLKKKGFITRLVKFDNDISKKMVQLFEDQNLDYQLVTPR